MQCIVALAPLLFLFCTPNNNHTTHDDLSKLDETIKNKETYIVIRQNKIDSLKIVLSTSATDTNKFALCNSLFDIYFDFQNDSAMVYANRMRHFAELSLRTNSENLIIANLKKVKLLRFTGQFKEAMDLLDIINRSELSENLRSMYIIEVAVTYSFLASNNSDSEHKERYNILSQIYRDSLLMDSSANISNMEIVRAERLLSQNRAKEALDILMEKYQTLDPLTKKAGTIAFNIALCYQKLGDETKYVEYLILSAITDLKNVVRGYRSLYNLAVALLERGDIEHAYKYMKCCMSDAISSNAKIRAYEASEMYIIIDKAYQILERQQYQKTLRYLLLLFVISCIMLLALIMVRYQNYKLTTTKRQLIDANLTKDGYLGIFIEEYSRHLFRINNYRLKVKKVMMTGNMAEIEAFIDKALNINDDMKELHRKFDASILQLFPNFIDEYNDLLKEEAVVKSTDNELTAEQRIAALMRLGIKECEKTALFLRYSTRTVYNYRSLMRAKSKDGSEFFEEKIMNIGLPKNKTRHNKKSKKDNLN